MRYKLIILLLCLLIVYGMDGECANNRRQPLFTSMSRDGHYMYIKHLEQTKNKITYYNFKIPVSADELNSFPLFAIECKFADEDSNQLLSDLNRIVSANTADEESVPRGDATYIKLYGDNPILVVLPSGIKEYTHEQQQGADKLLSSLDEKSCIKRGAMDYGSRIDMSRRLMDNFWEEDRFFHFRPALVSGLTAIGGWKNEFLYDKDWQVRFSAVGIVTDYKFENQVYFLKHFLGDPNSTVALSALIGIKYLDVSQKDDELKRIVERLIVERAQDDGGMLGKAFDYKYPFEVIGKEVLDNWDKSLCK